LFAEIEEFRAGEVGSQVGYDAIWYPKPEYYVLYESTALAGVKEAIGLYSIHLVNLSMATNM
jgi:hypothetical protein